MNASQRVIAAMQGHRVDRIPVIPKIWVDYGARMTGTDLREIIQDPLTALRVIAQAGRRLGCDAVRQFHFPQRKIVEKDDGIYEVGRSGRILGKIDLNGGLATHLIDSDDYNIEDPVTMAHCHTWSAGKPLVESLRDARAIAVPDAAVFDSLGWAARQKMVMEEFGSDLCFIGNCDSATMTFYCTFRGIENAMMDLITDPPLVHAVMEKGVLNAIARGRYWLDHGLRILRLNDSTGNMSLISPAHWKEFIFPHIKTVCDDLHRYNPEALIYCHICGNILPIIDLLVQTGLDCISPLDPLGNFSVAQARKAAGDSVSLMGGVNTLTLLQGTPEQVRAEARQCMEGAGERGGFILGSGCVVPRNCPVENLQTLVEAAKEYSCA